MSQESHDSNGGQGGQEASLLGGGGAVNNSVKGANHNQNNNNKAPSHSRQSSYASNHSGEVSSQRNSMTSTSANAGDLGDCHRGIIVGLHRKMVRYF